MKKNYFLSILFCCVFSFSYSQTTFFWRTEATDNSWQTVGNWWNGSAGVAFAYGQQEWHNNHELSQTSSSDENTYRFVFQAGASNVHTFSGNQVSFFDFGGDDPMIINNSGATHIINNNLVGDPDAADPFTLQINNTGGLTLGGTINNQGWLDVNGSASSSVTVTLNGVVSGTGGITKENANITLITNTDNTYSGATNLNAGTMQLNGSLTNSDVTVASGATLQVSSNATLKSLTVNAGGIVIIDADVALTITGTLTNNGTSFTINSGATMTVGGTGGTGDYTFNRNLTNGSQWYLMSSPVNGETYDDSWVTANSIPSSTADTGNRGISWYDNSSSDTDTDGSGTDDSATGYWRYMEGGTSGSFAIGRGYGIIKSATGNISFTGSGIYSSDQTFALTQGENNFNLVGNPFTASLNLAAFFNDNGESVISGGQVWFWNGSSYDVRTSEVHGSYEIAAGQGFFVEAVAATNLTFDYSDVSHNAATFQKTSRPEITITLSDGTQNRNAYVYYIDGTTKDYDLGYEGNLFGGVNHSLAVYTQLLMNDQGKKYQLQSLPNSEHEKMVVPVGIIADAGEEITFTAEVMNLPAGLKVFLEDRETNTFTRLDDANGEYKVTLSQDVNDVGRFYLHTTTAALSVPEVHLENVSVYTTHATNIRIEGIALGKTQMKLVNMLGKEVLQQNFSSNGVSDIAIPKLARGIYIVQLNTEKGKLNKKIIID